MVFVMFLHKDGRSLMDIYRIVRIRERSLQQWVKEFCEDERMAIPEHAASPQETKKLI